jgi:hypothetical protein
MISKKHIQFDVETTGEPWLIPSLQNLALLALAQNIAQHCLESKDFLTSYRTNFHVCSTPELHELDCAVRAAALFLFKRKNNKYQAYSDASFCEALPHSAFLKNLFRPFNPAHAKALDELRSIFFPQDYLFNIAGYAEILKSVPKAKKVRELFIEVNKYLACG